MKRLVAISAFMFSLAAPFSALAAGNSDTMNFRFSPVGLIIGAVSLDYDIAINDSWTLGPTLSYWHFRLGSTGTFSSDFDVTTFSAGARANWFNNGVFNSGLYVGPNAGYQGIKISYKDSDGSSTSVTGSLPYVGCLVGYAWFWDSFNIMLGGGARLNMGKASRTVTNSDGTTTTVNTAALGGLDLEFSLGWKF